MKHALLDGTLVKAQWAAELADEKFLEVRARFTCVGCNAQAYLNKGSRYQEPYFASKDHSDDCKEAYQGTSSSDTVLVEANTVVIMIGSNEVTSEQHRTTEDVSSRRRTTISQNGGISEVRVRRGVDSILQQILVDSEFATSAKTIVVGKDGTPASEFFVPFLELGPQHSGRMIGVWGEVSSFRTLTSITFLNRGDEKVDIRIPNLVFDNLKKLYKVTSNSQLERAKFLLIGTFDMHLQCYIKDARQIAFQAMGKE